MTDKRCDTTRVVVTLRYVSLRYVTLRYVTVPLGEDYVRPLCPPGDAIYARSSPARPGRRGGGSCSWVIGVVSIYLVTLWCSTTHPPIFSRSALRRAARRLGKFDLDYVTLRNYA